MLVHHCCRYCSRGNWLPRFDSQRLDHAFLSTHSTSRISTLPLLFKVMPETTSLIHGSSHFLLDCIHAKLCQRNLTDCAHDPPSSFHNPPPASMQLLEHPRVLHEPPPRLLSTIAIAAEPRRAYAHTFYTTVCPQHSVRHLLCMTAINTRRC